MLRTIAQPAEWRIGAALSAGLTLTHYGAFKHCTSLTDLKSSATSQTWNGTYSKMTNGATEFVAQPEAGVTMINGFGDSEMTLSFGLAGSGCRDFNVTETSSFKTYQRVIIDSAI